MRRRADLEAIYRAGVAAVDPARLISEHVSREGQRVRIDVGDRCLRIAPQRLWVAGAGKAAAAMAAAVAEIAPDSSGVVIAPRGHGRLPRAAGTIEILRGSHPVPDRWSFDATERLLRRLGRRPPTDTVLFLLSGGASALLSRPAVGISRRDKTLLGRHLLRCGADISLTNAVRKHVSAVKGGGLLRAAAPRRVVTLALSDVIGDALPTIGSGPTVPDPSTYDDAWRGLEALDALDGLPRAVRRRLVAGREGDAAAPETVKPGSAAARAAIAAVVGSNQLALRAAAGEARRRGYRVRTLRRPLRSEAAEEARSFVAALGEADAPTCVLAGGETTVRVGAATGRGGRCQEFAVAAMEGLDGGSWSLLAAGTDGIDGQTDAAGGFADGRSRRRAGARRVTRALREHDAGTLLAELGDALITGPSGTNVMDVVVALGGRDKK